MLVLQWRLGLPAPRCRGLQAALGRQFSFTGSQAAARRSFAVERQVTVVLRLHFGRETSDGIGRHPAVSAFLS